MDNGVDAELLARLGRVDPSLLKPIVHRGAQAQRDRILIQSRAGFVRARTQLVNQVQGFAKALGVRLPPSSTEAFPKRVRAATPLDRFPGLATLLETIDQLTTTIRQMDREAERLGRERYPETELLRQVPGVGAITALYYVLTIEDPSRRHRLRCPMHRHRHGWKVVRGSRPRPLPKPPGSATRTPHAGGIHVESQGQPIGG